MGKNPIMTAGAISLATAINSNENCAITLFDLTVNTLYLLYLDIHLCIYIYTFICFCDMTGFVKEMLY